MKDVDLKMDSELNSVSQNSTVFTPRSKRAEKRRQYTS